MDYNTQDIINDLNAISYQENDLIILIHEFCDSYFKQNPDEQVILDKFFANDIFVNQSVNAVRESVVLGVNGLILENNVNFKEIIMGCTNKELEKEQLSKLNTDEKTNKIIINFWYSLRKEVFSRIFSQNKSLNKVTELSKELLLNRCNQFLTYFKAI